MILVYDSSLFKRRLGNHDIATKPTDRSRYKAHETDTIFRVYDEHYNIIKY